MAQNEREMTLTADIDRIEAALLEAHNNPGTAERVFAQKGMNEFRVLQYLERRGILTASGAWIGPEPTRALAGWIREECGALKPVKVKRTVQARVESGPVEMTTIKAKPARKKREIKAQPAPEAPPVDPNWVRATNWKQSNVYPNLKEWYAKFGREE